MHVTQLVQFLGGIANRRQLEALGATGFEMTRAVRLRELRRIRRGWYATVTAPRAAVLAVRVGGVLGGVTAAATYSLWSGIDRRIHVALPDNASRLRTNYAPSVSSELTPDVADDRVVLHWWRFRHEYGPTPAWRPPVLETLAQVALWSDRETALACMDTALALKAVTGRQLVTRFALLPASLRLLAARAQPGSGSGLESIVRQGLDRAGIRYLQQAQLDGVGRVDFLIGRVVVEIDGAEFHRSWDQQQEDRRRDAELVVRGFIVLRFTYAQVTQRWDWVIGAIRAAVARSSAA